VVVVLVVLASCTGDDGLGRDESSERTGSSSPTLSGSGGWLPAPTTSVAAPSVSPPVETEPAGGIVTVGPAFVNRDDGGGADSVKSIAVFRNDGTWPIGAVVTVFDTEGDPIAVDEVRTDYSYRAKRTPLLHFGLGAVDTVDVRITLPFDGGTTWHRDVPVDQLARLSR
jgi:hypothetical protein